jgi:hypothetical protein
MAKMAKIPLRVKKLPKNYPQTENNDIKTKNDEK